MSRAREDVDRRRVVIWALLELPLGFVATVVAYYGLPFAVSRVVSERVTGTTLRATISQLVDTTSQVVVLSPLLVGIALQVWARSSRVRSAGLGLVTGFVGWTAVVVISAIVFVLVTGWTWGD